MVEYAGLNLTNVSKIRESESIKPCERKNRQVGDDRGKVPGDRRPRLCRSPTPAQA
jgi:hypothetical protein